MTMTNAEYEDRMAEIAADILLGRLRYAIRVLRRSGLKPSDLAPYLRDRLMWACDADNGVSLANFDTEVRCMARLTLR